jgi:hypothetical protein
MQIQYTIDNWLTSAKKARKFIEEERSTEKHWLLYENLYKQML